MKRALIYTLIVAVAVVFSAVMYAAVIGSAHDFSTTGPVAYADSTVTWVCVFCHTAHQSGTTVDPLWNHTLSATAAYGVYASDTLDAVPTEIGGGTSVSNLCMSCHDGTVAVGDLYNDPLAWVPDSGLVVGTANLGTDLTNDHPVNFTYNAALAATDGELVVPTSVDYVDAGSTVPLFNGSVQCASCHDPHIGTPGLLVVSNGQSALCLTCHVK